MEKIEFFNKLDTGSRFKVITEDGETETLIKMTTICKTLFDKIEFNAIFSNTAEPYPTLLTALDLVTAKVSY